MAKQGAVAAAGGTLGVRAPLAAPSGTIRVLPGCCSAPAWTAARGTALEDCLAGSCMPPQLSCPHGTQCSSGLGLSGASWGRSCDGSAWSLQVASQPKGLPASCPSASADLPRHKQA